MYFIGIISNNKSFEKIRKKVLENIKHIKMNIINVTIQNIENIQNVKFTTIVIDENLDKFKNKAEYLQKICINSKYVLLNADIELKTDILKNEKVSLITYGLNQKATVTVSSMADSAISIYIQRNMNDIKKRLIGVEEKHIKLKTDESIKVYEILIIYIILKIYEENIIEQL